MIRILVAEDHLVARVGLTAILSAQSDMSVAAEAVNGRQAVDLFLRCRPDVTLMDLRMPVMSGVDAAMAIRAHQPGARMIALTTYGGDEDIRRALDAGFRAYLTKDGTREELLNAIRTVHKGQSYLPSTLAEKLEAKTDTEHLSSREVEVLALISEGFSNKEIAYRLNIAEATAKNHVRNILGKLGVHDRTGATRAAIERGIIHI